MERLVVVQCSMYWIRGENEEKTSSATGISFYPNHFCCKQQDPRDLMGLLRREVELYWFARPPVVGLHWIGRIHRLLVLQQPTTTTTINGGVAEQQSQSVPQYTAVEPKRNDRGLWPWCAKRVYDLQQQGSLLVGLRRDVTRLLMVLLCFEPVFLCYLGTTLPLIPILHRFPRRNGKRSRSEAKPVVELICSSVVCAMERKITVWKLNDLVCLLIKQQFFTGRRRHLLVCFCQNTNWVCR